VRELARGIVEDPEYLKNLRARMIAGEAAPAVETAVMRYAWGDPPKSDDDGDDERERFDKMRLVMIARVKEGAHLEDARVMGARRVLSLPPPEPALDDEDGPPDDGV
jgi:hypothetical protein